MNFSRKIITMLLGISIFLNLSATKFETDAVFQQLVKNHTLKKDKEVNSWLELYKKNIKKWKLENGLTVLYYPIKNSPNVHLQVTYNVGSKDETPLEFGFAHAVEHMTFKGTDLLSEEDINEIMKKYGSSGNAFTSKDFTTFLFDTDQNHWPIFLGILEDWMQNVKFEEEHFASEVKAIINELKMYNDSANEKAFDWLNSLVYPYEHPYHHPIIGYKENLINASAQDLKNFYKQHYGPNTAILIVTGNVDEEDLKRKINDSFGRLPSNKQCKNTLDEKVTKPQAPPLDFISTRTIIHRHSTSTELNFVWHIPGSMDSECIFSDVIVSILNERLQNKFTTTPNLFKNILGVSAGMSLNFLGGYIFLSASPKDEKSRTFFNKLFHPTTLSEQCLKLIEDETSKLANTGVTADELCRYKSNMLTTMLTTFSNEISAARTLNGSYMVYRNEMAAFDEFQKVLKITNEDIIKFCKRYLKPNLMHTVLCCDIPEEDSEYWTNLQKEIDAYDALILSKKNRTSKIDEPIFVNELPAPKPLETTFKAPDESIELENGLIVVLKHTETEPFLRTKLMFKNSTEMLLKLEQDQLGFVKNYSMSYLNSDTKILTEKEIQEFLAHANASMWFNNDGGGFQCLYADFDLVAAKFMDSLTLPDYPAKKINAAVLNDIYSIHQDKRSARNVLDKTLNMHLFKEYPWIKTDEELIKELQLITRKKLFNFHQKYINPQNMFLVIAGNYDRQKIKEQLNNTFGKWHKQGSKLDVADLKIPEITNPKSARFLKTFPTEQCMFFGARVTTYRGNKDFLCLGLLEEYTNKKLFDLREQSGLFYGCQASLTTNPTYKTKGKAVVGAMISHDKIEEAEKSIKGVLHDIALNGITEQELVVAKNNWQSIYAKALSTNSDLVNGYANIYTNNLGWDYYDKQLDIVKNLTLNDVNTVAKKYLNPDEWTFVITGRVEEEKNEETKTTATA